MFSVNSLPRVFRHIRNLLILLSPVAVAAAFACDSLIRPIGSWRGTSFHSVVYGAQLNISTKIFVQIFQSANHLVFLAFDRIVSFSSPQAAGSMPAHARQQ